MTAVDARAWDERYAAAELLWSAEPNRFLVEEVAGLAPGRALDLACGEGRNALWLADRGWRVVGVDFSAVALERARRMAAARRLAVEWVLADVRSWEPSAAGFDLVIVMYLHLPWQEMSGVLRRAAGWLVPGGTLLVVGHDTTNLTRGHGGPRDPAVLYGPDDVVGALGGLTVLRADRVVRRVETDQGPRDAIDVLVRAVAPRRTGGQP